MSRPFRTLEQATKDFWAKTRKDGDCIVWTGANSRGYGKLTWYSKVRWAHIVAHELAIGPVPEGLEVMHLCDRPACVNPDHLTLGTHQMNMMDRSIKGKHAGANKTHCVNGHEFDDENTHIYKGGRICRECSREASRRFSEKRKVAV